MAAMKDFVSKFSDYQNNKQLILSTAAIALLLFSASIVFVATATTKSNQEIKTLSTTTHAVSDSTGEKLPSSLPKDITEASLNEAKQAVKLTRDAILTELRKLRAARKHRLKVAYLCRKDLQLMDKILHELEKAKRNLKKYSYEDIVKKFATLGESSNISYKSLNQTKLNQFVSVRCLMYS